LSVLLPPSKKGDQKGKLLVSFFEEHSLSRGQSISQFFLSPKEGRVRQHRCPGRHEMELEEEDAEGGCISRPLANIITQKPLERSLESFHSQCVPIFRSSVNTWQTNGEAEGAEGNKTY
jgi:hypothetical protein